jgi:uncharacterized membrane protein
MIIFLALMIGIVAGLRAMMAPAIVSWAAQRGGVDVSGTWLAFVGYRWTPWVFTIAAAAELITDQLPSTPSRKVPPQFGARIVMGALSGAVIAASSGAWLIGLMAGALGAVVGTFGGSAARTSMASFFKSDRPAALIEDAVAIIAALLIVSLAG